MELLDSLMALRLIRILRRGLQLPDLGLTTIYSNPTVSQLQAAITSGQDPSKDSDAMLIEPFLKTNSGLIQQIQKPTSPPAGQGARGGPVTVVLTGSTPTGTIGTFLRRALLKRPYVERVICLNRSQDGGRAPQRARLAAAGLETGDLDRRVTFHHADLSQLLLGLDGATYEDLRARVGLIIHNAWAVNFNLGLFSGRPCHGTRRRRVRRNNKPSGGRCASVQSAEPQHDDLGLAAPSHSRRAGDACSI